MASSEFGMDAKTLAQRIRKYGIDPGPDGRLSTRQICAAIFGDIDSEKLRLTKEQADKVEWENRINRKEYISGEQFQQLVERGLGAMVAAVNSAANLESEDKAKIINHLRACGESVAIGLKGGSPAPELQSQ